MDANVIGQLYEASLRPDGLRTLLALIAKYLQAQAAMLMMSGLKRAPEQAFFGAPPRTLEAFLSYHHAAEVRAIARRALPRRPAAAVDDESGLAAPPEPHGIQCDDPHEGGTSPLIGGHIPLEDGSVCSLAAHRESRARPFGRWERDWLAAALPHLQRALLARSRTAMGDPQASHALSALNALAIGAIVSSPLGEVLLANRAAEEMVRESSALRFAAGPNRITMASPADARRLERLIASASGGGRGGAMLCAGRSGERLLVLVAPIPDHFGTSPGAAAIFLRSISSPPMAPDGLLREAFSLTPAEARLAEALPAGASLVELAAQRGLKEATLRTQLASVIRKTGANSQKDLIRMLSQVTPLAVPEGLTSAPEAVRPAGAGNV